jgi:hypothetical protein
MMPEILTESFCERCGTRYTFESAAPRKIRRLGQFKTLSKGLKNYVLSDETSMDEAMALARGDEEREATAQQLDAFHATFNFCMNCRQYTCSNCWNQAEGRCLTCAPLGHEILQSPFPKETPFEPIGIAADAWPTADLPPLEVAAADHAGNGSNGLGSDEVTASPASLGAPVAHDPVSADDDRGAYFSFLSVDQPGTEADVVSTAATTEPAAASEEATLESIDEAATTPFAEAAPDEAVVADAAPAEAVIVDTWVAEETPAEAFAAETQTQAEESIELAAADEPSPAPGADLDAFSETVEERATTLASHTSDLLSRFRPGQNIDAELEAYEAGFDAALAATSGTAAEPEPVAAEPEPEPIAASVEPEPEPIALVAEPIIAAEPEPEPVVAIAEPEPEAAAAAAEPEPEPEPIAAIAEPEPEPIALVAEPIIAAEPEPEPVVAIAEPEPEAAAAAAEPEPEPIAAIAEPEPEPIAASVEAEPQPVAPPVEPAREDRVPQPTWRIFAPDQMPPGGVPPFVAPGPPPTSLPPSARPAASSEPQWPAQPGWQDSPSVALLTNRTRQSSDALWAASSQEVLAPAPAGPAATAGVQPCSSCGLSLSATARFCRRCGTRQG